VQGADGKEEAIRLPVDEEYRSEKLALRELWCKLTRDDDRAFDDLSAAVENEYAAAVRRVTANDIAFVLDKRGERALNSLEKNAPDWAAVLTERVRGMLAMLHDVMAGEFRAPWQTMAAVTAMMQYLMNPHDLLPDTVPGLGHVDDALVVALCLAVVRKDFTRHVHISKLAPPVPGK
jgi:uncharacterized membrane protein YkvA (DUF1232 family)